MSWETNAPHLASTTVHLSMLLHVRTYHTIKLPAKETANATKSDTITDTISDSIVSGERY